MRNLYVERVERAGRVEISVIPPNEDGGTGSRWSASWHPTMDGGPDIDAEGVTLEEALHNLLIGLGEEILDLRRKAGAE